MDIYVAPGLSAQSRGGERRQKKLRVTAGGESFPIGELGREGFTLAGEARPNLRGLVDIYDGTNHILQALVVRAGGSGEAPRYEFKLRTQPRDKAPRDFAVDPAAPVGLLPQN